MIYEIMLSIKADAEDEDQVKAALKEVLRKDDWNFSLCRFLRVE